jgi:hypothetical protein
MNIDINTVTNKIRMVMMAHGKPMMTLSGEPAALEMTLAQAEEFFRSGVRSVEVLKSQGKKLILPGLGAPLSH